MDTKRFAVWSGVAGAAVCAVAAGVLVLRSEPAMPPGPVGPASPMVATQPAAGPAAAGPVQAQGVEVLGQRLMQIAAVSGDDAIDRCLSETIQQVLAQGLTAADAIELAVRMACAPETPAAVREKTLEALIRKYPAAGLQDRGAQQPQLLLLTAFLNHQQHERVVSYVNAMASSIRGRAIAIDRVLPLAYRMVAGKLDQSASDERDLFRRLADTAVESFPASRNGLTGQPAVQGCILGLMLRAGQAQRAAEWTGSLLQGPMDPAAQGQLSQVLLSALQMKPPLEAFEELLLKTASGTGGDWAEKVWTALVETIPASERRDHYRRLVAGSGMGAAGAARALLGKMPSGASVASIVEDRAELIVSEIELGSMSVALHCLVKELADRNAFADLAQVTEFLWRSFPSEPVGRQAFALWATHLGQFSDRSVATEEAWEAIRCLPGSEVARAARLALAQDSIARGQVLEALVLVGQSGQADEATRQSVLTVPVIKELVSGYVRGMADNGVSIDRLDLMTALADQLAQAGEKQMAASLLWDVAQSRYELFADARTGLPLDPPIAVETDAQRDAQYRFWRILAMLARAKLDEAEQDLALLGKEHPEARPTGLARYYMALRYAAAKKDQRAWELIRECPEDLRLAGEGAALYSRLMNSAPKAAAAKQLDSRIGEIKAALAREGSAPDADKLLMELADLLSQKGKFSESAVNYEAVYRRFPGSGYGPEALYRAILIYKTKAVNRERAAHLLELLRGQFPTSRYVSMAAAIR